MTELTPIDYGRIVRPSIAHNIEKINEIVDWINNSEIKSTKLLETGSGTSIEVGDATQLATLGMEGKAVQDRTPTPDSPVPIQVLKGRNLLDFADFVTRATESSISGINALAYQLEPNNSYTISTNSPMGATVTGSADVFAATDNEPSTAENSATLETPRTVTTGNDGILYIMVRAAAYANFTSGIYHIQLEIGSTPTPYVPYGHIGLEVRDSNDELVNVTPIPLPAKGFAAALPNGIADALNIDITGKYEWIIQVSAVDMGMLTWSSPENSIYFGDGLVNAKRGMWSYDNPNNCMALGYTPRSTMYLYYASDSNMIIALWDTGSGDATNRVGVRNTTIASAEALKAQLSGVMLYYELATSTTESGYIDMPSIPDNATLRILATLETTFNAGWFTEDALPEVVNALVKRIENVEAAIENGRSTASLGSQSTSVSSQSTIIKDTDISIERDEDKTLVNNDTEVI